MKYPDYCENLININSSQCFFLCPKHHNAVLHQMRLKRFFLGMLLTLIFFIGPVWFLRGLKRFTWSPTLIFLVRAPWGNTACTCGTTVDDTIPPSGPIAWTYEHIGTMKIKNKHYYSSSLLEYCHSYIQKITNGYCLEFLKMGKD